MKIMRGERNRIDRVNRRHINIHIDVPTRTEKKYWDI